MLPLVVAHATLSAPQPKSWDDRVQPIVQPVPDLPDPAATTKDSDDD